MATSVTGGSTPRLSEVARHVNIPKGIVTTVWPRVVAQCEDVGVVFDSWQHGIGTIALGKRKDGKYAATVGGVVLSIPRQVGKTFLVGMIVIALCMLYPGLTVLWSAHRTRTATKTFGSLKGITSRKKIAPFMLEPRNANGEQEIRFRNGSVIMFGAREQGFGRGFDEVDIEVFDEGQILTEKALEDMVPAVNQSRHEAGGLLFFMGTPPRPSDPGEEFANRRAKALAGKAPNMVYVEFSADPDADCDDKEQWAKANPSFPVRTPLESMERMRENLTDDDSFRREALGIWGDSDGHVVIDRATWDLRGDEFSRPVDNFALAVGVSPDRTSAAVGWCGRRADGLWHIELDEHRNGVGWVAGYVADRCAKNKFRSVVVNGSSPASTVVEDLLKMKVKVTVMTAPDVAQAFGMFYDGVMGVLDEETDVFVGSTVRHIEQPQLTAALAVAGKRDLSGGSAWSQKNSRSDITCLEACTFALWGAQSSKVNRPTRGEPTKSRAVVFR